MAEAEVIQLAGRARRRAGAGARTRCRAVTGSGRRCRNYAVGPSGYCRVHETRERAAGAGRAEKRKVVPGPGEEDGSFGDFVRRRLSGDYPVDDFGYDPELSRTVLLPLMKPLYERYFRVRTIGIDRIPATGAALLVANHSGTIPLDGAVLQYAVATEHPQKRVVRHIAANLAFRTPFFGPIARKSGAALANDEDAQELLRRGEIVGVFPEGFKGVGKGWSERYRLQRFGRGGFIQLALRNRVPIIPISIVGAEEAYPMIANLRVVARIFGFPYFPITPTFPLLGPLGALPLPSRWLIEFGEPIPMDAYPEDAAEDPMLVFDLSDRVRDIIQQMLYRNLKLRGNAFF
ncbi:MAG TPA: lysophospholipid acyltransferase family protein [Actinomycetota bacterium]|nr:lysophospholipid acyltransferase family protein [Actinomycetota bacterium]